MLGGGCLPDLVSGAFFLARIGSGSGFDSDTDSDPVSSVSSCIDSSNLDSNFSISVGGGFGVSFQIGVEGGDL